MSQSMPEENRLQKSTGGDALASASVAVAPLQDCWVGHPQGRQGKPPKVPLLTWNGGGWSLVGLSESLSLPNELQHFMTLTRALLKMF